MSGLRADLDVALAPEPPRRWRTIAIDTAQTKYLLFDERGSSPRYVAQYGDRNTLERLRDHAAGLHELLPDRIAAPRALSAVGVDGERALYVQHGLPGTPWFQMRERLRSPRRWCPVRDAAIEALGRFRRAVATRPDWHDELDTAAAFDRLRPPAGEPDPGAPCAQAWREALSGLSSGPHPRQHGDFCLNNLLIDGNRAAMVDLEHFGSLAHPLHDEFMLVDSLLDHRPAGATDSTEALWASVREGSPSGFEPTTDEVEALFALHLYWWLAECRDNRQREGRRGLLADTLERLCANRLRGRRFEPSLLYVGQGRGTVVGRTDR